MRRYPLQPLLEAMRCTLSQAAPQLNLNGTYYRRYRDEGMARDTAERLALKAGFHPYEIVEWDMARHDLEDAHEADRVKQRRYQRNWYRNASPDVKAKVLEAARRYKRENSRAIRLYNKQYRERNRDRIAARQREHYQQNRDRILARQRDYDARRRAERKAS